jgi:hypothetical protein
VNSDWLLVLPEALRLGVMGVLTRYMVPLHPSPQGVVRRVARVLIALAGKTDLVAGNKRAHLLTSEASASPTPPEDIAMAVFASTASGQAFDWSPAHGIRE